MVDPGWREPLHLERGRETIRLAASVRQTTRRHTPAHYPARRRHAQNHPLASGRQTPVTCHWKNVGHLQKCR